MSAQERLDEAAALDAARYVVGIFRETRVVRGEHVGVDGCLALVHALGETGVRAGREVVFDVDGRLAEDAPGSETYEQRE